MKIVQINATCGSGSTGKICVAISKLLSERQIENYILYCSGNSKYSLGIKCADSEYIRRQAFNARIKGNWGFNSDRSTERMISELERIKPDIVHLHNIHGHDCNLEKLFTYFQEKKTKLYWTFHDCWAFTGYCTYFDLVKCSKWKTKCHSCVQRKGYSWFFDKSPWIYERKKQLFSDLNMTIITPSQWLADLVKESFLKDYPVKVIQNGINLSIFKPMESEFRKKYHLENKYIVLGVAFDWGVRKGLDVFLELAKHLGEKYQIVLVGTNDNVDKYLPSNIISIHRTQNQIELAEIYSAADVFVNPTREDNYPTVNMEAIACGTPVITFRTGGSPEMIGDNCGVVVGGEDVDMMCRHIKNICTEVMDYSNICHEYARIFDDKTKYMEYVQLYQL